MMTIPVVSDIIKTSSIIYKGKIHDYQVPNYNNKKQYFSDN